MPGYVWVEDREEILDFDLESDTDEQAPQTKHVIKYKILES